MPRDERFQDSSYEMNLKRPEMVEDCEQTLPPNTINFSLLQTMNGRPFGINKTGFSLDKRYVVDKSNPYISPTLGDLRVKFYYSTLGRGRKIDVTDREMNAITGGLALEFLEVHAFHDIMDIMDGGQVSPMHTFSSGAKSSKKKDRFDLVPRVAIERIARRFEKGVPIHGTFNYRKGFGDKEFIIDRINHLQDHLQKFMSPRNVEEFNDDNLGAIGWCVCFLMELEETEVGQKLLTEIRSERSYNYSHKQVIDAKNTLSGTSPVPEWTQPKRDRV